MDGDSMRTVQKLGLHPQPLLDLSALREFTMHTLVQGTEGGMWEVVKHVKSGLRFIWNHFYGIFRQNLEDGMDS